jgi:hypothetical protein
MVWGNRQEPPRPAFPEIPDRNASCRAKESSESRQKVVDIGCVRKEYIAELSEQRKASQYLKDKRNPLLSEAPVT